MLVLGLTRYNAIVYFVFRLKDENGEELYPRSSFLINCRGISLFFFFSVCVCTFCFCVGNLQFVT
jgi:hypothetical protein